MKQQKPLAYAITLALTATAIQTAQATPSGNTEERLTIEITSGRFARSLEQVIAPVTVITRQQLDQQQPNSLAEAIESTSGLQVVNSGGYGQNSSLYLRGLDQKRMLVLIDGVQTGSATLGTTSLEHFPVQQIERIEIVRGARSSLYGSNAIAGVIQIFTRRNHQKNSYGSIEAGAGSNQSRQLAVSGGWSSEQTRIRSSASYFATDGFDVWDKDGEDGEDKDGYENRSFKLDAEHDLTNTMLSAGVHYTEGSNDYDQCSKPDWSKSNDCEALFDNTTLYVAAESELSDSLNISTRLSHYEDNSQQEIEDNKGDKFVTRTDQFSVQADQRLNNQHTLMGGLDYRQDKISGSGVADYQDDKRDNKALFGLWQWQQGRFSSGLSARLDDNQAFGSHDTYNLEGRFALTPELILTASHGTAFTAPTFNDLYAPDTGYTAGNPDLKPETAETTSLGIRYQITPALHTSFNIYTTNVDDMINWAPDANDKWTPTNIDSARIKGAEIATLYQWSDTRLEANIEWLDAENADTNQQLIYRAEHKASLRLSHQIGALTLGSSVLYIGDRYADSANTDKLSGYTLVNTDARYQVNRQLQLALTIKNLMDENYISKKNYATEGRSISGSVRYRF
ncbi:TonB-dependent receptor domain-containing protein [Oceanospirillum sediminis]|uniref:TonB-dependent receptor n=1 Tax=Oceanospirillum sediminis TaxID=2760088 RepID=A0A839INL5_9GAMM|nr:TonB-dependent receptor [Oceanospirillum sediminis]MBB1486102.1 TonB-dependent receptor [Oceanospirillum sediminis]